MQNSATLRNALRKLNYALPSVGNAVQSSETLRNSLGLNYESPALTAELQARFCTHIIMRIADDQPRKRQLAKAFGVRACSNH